MADEALSTVRVAVAGMTGMVGSRFQQIVPWANAWDRLVVDISDHAAAASAVAATEAEVIVNLAAYRDVSAAGRQRGDTSGPCYQINVVGTKNLAEACLDAGKHFVHVSTDYVFEGDREEPYLETDEGDARTDWYAITKRMAEEWVKRLGGSWSIARLSFPYHRQPGSKEDFVHRIARLLAEGVLPPMFMDQFITPTFVDDACIMLAAVAAGRLQGVFHTVGSETLTPYCVPSKVAEHLGVDANEIRSSSLRDYIAQGGRPFPRCLKMSNEATLAALGVTTHTISEVFTGFSAGSKTD